MSLISCDCYNLSESRRKTVFDSRCADTTMLTNLPLQTYVRTIDCHDFKLIP